MIIQHNIMALNSYNRLSNNNSAVAKNIEKLSSGFKINRAGDDAAGLAISEKMRAQITGLERATQNSQDGISLIQTAEGQLTEVHSMLNRMVDLATQSSNGTYADAVDRENLQLEVDSLLEEIDRIGNNANFNGITLLDGSKAGRQTLTNVGTGIEPTAGFTDFDISGLKYAGAMDGTNKKLEVSYDAASKTFTATLDIDGVKTTEDVKITGAPGTNQSQTVSFGTIGLKFKINHGFDDTADIDAGDGGITSTYAAGQGISLQIGDTAVQRVDLSIKDMRTAALGLAGLDISTEAAASGSIQTVKDAINLVSQERANLGATQNRLEHTINNLTTTAENMTAAESRIRDTDMAKEMMTFTKNNVLSQAAQAMLAQANQQPQQVLQLLR